jgi:hypothetical protein
VFDIDPDNRKYFVREGNVERTVIDPYVVRPGLTLGVVTELLP